MSLCTRNRWGTGSTNNCMPNKTQEAKEAEDKLKKILEERAKQDAKWMLSFNPNNNTTQGK